MKTVGLVVTCLILLQVVKVSSQEETPPPPPPVVDQAQREKQQILLQEEQKRTNVGFNYEHVQTYTFEVKAKTSEDFILQVDHDHTIRGILAVYWLQDGVYLEASHQQGEEIRLLIYENRRQLLANEFFFKASGFSFEARKNNEYLLRFINDGKDKLILMNLQHYVAAGKTSNALSTEHVNAHDTKIRSIKDRLTTFLGVIEYHAVFNRNIANGILKQTSRFLAYQIFQIVFVVAATITQIYTIRRLLHKTSVV